MPKSVRVGIILKNIIMNNMYSFSGVLFLIFLMSSNPPTAPDAKTSEIAPAHFKMDFKYNVTNSNLEARFEVQFSDLIANVAHVDVHHNELNGYYYAVYGTNTEGESVVDYFKTTGDEVKAEKYDYIKLNDQTRNGLSSCNICREDFNPNTWSCNTSNFGPVCGVYDKGYCWIY